MKKGVKPSLILIAVLVISAIIAKYYLETNKSVNIVPTITSPTPPSNTDKTINSSNPLPTLNLTADMFQITGGNWSIYSDSKYNYSIDYPTNWTVNNGIFTPPGGKPNYSGISITKRQKVSDHINDDFATYVKNYAGLETSPIRIPLAMSKITTQTGIVGYIIEWKASPWSKNLKTYTTFFALPNDTTSVLEIAGIENDNMDIYYKMLPTFKFTKKF